MRTDRQSRAYDRDTWEKRKRDVRERVSILSVVERVVTLKKSGAKSKQGCCPFHDEATASFTVYPEGSHRIPVGFFVCYGCGAKGDVIAFTMKRQGLDFREAIELLESEGGLSRLQAAPAPQKVKAAQVGDRDKLNRAHRILNQARALVPDDPVDRYLRQREIVSPATYGIGDAEVNAGWPVDLRFHPRCWHYLEEKNFPAMVAAIRAHDGTLLTVHQTYLERCDDGTWRKASISKAKLVAGPFEPGFIRLGPDAGKMLGGEGIESSLSAMQLFKRSGLSFVNSGRMRTTEPPFACGDFVYAADKGGKGRWGEVHAHAGAKAFGVGRKTAVLIPKIAADKGDFNDLVQMVARGDDPMRQLDPPSPAVPPPERRSPPPVAHDREADRLEVASDLRAAEAAEREAWLRYSAACAGLDRAEKADRQGTAALGALAAAQQELQQAGTAWKAACATAKRAAETQRRIA